MYKRTLVIIKPDAFDNDWAAQIEVRYEKAGLRVIYAKLFKMEYDWAASFYAEHAGKFFFSGLKLAMSSGPSGVLILEGDNAIERVRELNGATDPSKAEPGTIRHDFRSAGGPFNTVHGSANQADFERELGLFVEWGVVKMPI